MALKILGVVVVLIAGILIAAAFQPAEYFISREVRINATPEAIFPHLNNPQKMNAWNPWMKADPQAKVTFTGPAEGIGATTTWEGNSQVGAGIATIIDSAPNTMVRTHLAYRKPFEGTSMAEFNVRPDGPQTIVGWSNRGTSAYPMRVMCLLFFNMTKMMNETFDRGLADLKTIVESDAKAQRDPKNQ